MELQPQESWIIQQLKMILARMDMCTLLRSAQRVSRTWFVLISKSPSDQKTRFSTQINDFEWRIWRIDGNILNLLLTETFLSLFPAKDRLYSCWFEVHDLPMTKDASTLARFVRKNAGWRKMLVQQALVSDIGLSEISSSKGRRWRQNL
ncbi:hypothetical protein N7507_002235 [Penicillium longicatenatum]|nr:hypothetical protein N7507_002235 [Penicillium longicatenatum]